jgi:hypothetical protein
LLPCCLAALLPCCLVALCCASPHQTLSTALDTLQQSLSSTGSGDQAKAVAQGRDNVEGKVKEAAGAVASFVKVGDTCSTPFCVCLVPRGCNAGGPNMLHSVWF